MCNYSRKECTGCASSSSSSSSLQYDPCIIIFHDIEMTIFLQSISAVHCAISKSLEISIYLLLVNGRMYRFIVQWIMILTGNPMHRLHTESMSRLHYNSVLVLIIS